MKDVSHSSVDAAPLLQSCIDKAAASATILIPNGTYLIGSPVRVSQPLTLSSASSPDRPCTDRAADCAVLHIEAFTDKFRNAAGPFIVSSPDVTIKHLVFTGTRLSNTNLAKALCSSDEFRRLGGGLLVENDHFSLTDAVLKDFGCFSALVFRGAKGLHVERTLFSSNGTHTKKNMWSDGLTISDTSEALIRDNVFIDNTDVQLIFGGCRRCVVTGNKFLHSGSAEGGSFAELMLHAWPNKTSGDYSGSDIDKNTIDCSTDKRCGFGIMIGSAPWYRAPAFGGRVSENIIANAMLGIAIEDLTGPMVVAGNRVYSSGGPAFGSCGDRLAPAVNVAPTSQNFVVSTKIVEGKPSSIGHETFAGCILNFDSQAINGPN